MDTLGFLDTVITTPGEGWFCLCLLPASGQGWREEYFRWPQQKADIIKRAEAAQHEFNVYFSTYLFKTQSTLKTNVLPGTRTIQADLDNADVLTLPLPPTVLIQTSPNRHQGYWVLNEEADDLDVHEHLSRNLTYSIEYCDHSGWPLGRKVRLPNTINHKYMAPAKVTIAHVTARQYDIGPFELLHDVNVEAVVIDQDEEWLDTPATYQGMGPQELLDSISSKITPKVMAQYNVIAEDRSAALWALMCAAFRAGLTRDEVFFLSVHSANNKFSGLNHNSNKELAKDVLRAQQVVMRATPDQRAAIAEARRMPGTVAEKNQQIAAQVMRYMQEEGDFVRTTDERAWYIGRDLGRPIEIAARSMYFNMILELRYGLNNSESVTRYVVYSIMNYCSSIPPTLLLGALTHFDLDTNTLLVHTGRKTVIRITATGVDEVGNGSYGVVFPWIAGSEAFAPRQHTMDKPWYEIMFGQSLNSVVGIDRAQAMALLRVWIHFVLLRNAATSRPILAFFGQPGSGKSTLFRIIYTLIYGKARSLSSVTSPDNFDHASATDPLLVLDNVDTPERWLPDRLALAAATSDITKRRLYSDTDTVVMRRQAIIGVTAHSPKFGREDVADRLLLFNFERIQHFMPEGQLIGAVAKARDEIWGAIVQEIHQILATPMPYEYPQFRVEDFARLGAWIATGVGCMEDFSQGIITVRSSQKTYSLEEEHLLVQALQTHVSRDKDNPNTFYGPAQLWQRLVAYSSDEKAFQQQYHNAVNLARKLWSLQEPLKQMFSIEYKFDTARGFRMWCIKNAED